MKIRAKCVEEYNDFQLAVFGLRFRVSSKSFHVERNQYENCFYASKLDQNHQMARWPSLSSFLIIPI